MPDIISKTGLQIIRPTDVWAGLTEDGNLSPKFGIGIFELLKDAFNEHFRYKAKYPVKVVIPRIPAQLSLFWASLFGEFPPTLSGAVENQYGEPLEIQLVDLTPDKFSDMLAGDFLFPRRIVQRGLTTFNHSGLGRDAALYFLDATKVEDIVDFWNLRAMGKEVLPIPKQFQDDPVLKNLVIGFLKHHRRPWRHNPKACDIAAIMRGRNCTMDELQEYAKTLTITKEPDDPSDSPFLSLQHWYPRVWDEWARDRDGAVPADVYGKAEGAVEIDSKKLQITFKP